MYYLFILAAYPTHINAPDSISLTSQSQSHSHITTDSQSASLSWCQATIWTCDQFCFHLEIFFRQLQICYFVAPSLTRGQVCNLVLLQGLVSAVHLWSESHGTQDHILLSQFSRLLQRGGSGSRIYIPQEQGGPVIPPSTGFPLYRLLRLAGLRWRYSNPPPHGWLNNVWWTLQVTTALGDLGSSWRSCNMETQLPPKQEVKTSIYEDFETMKTEATFSTEM
jgi:hypothetical protein